MNITRVIFSLLFCVASQQTMAQSASALNLQLPAPTTSNQTTEVATPQPAATTAIPLANTANLSPPYDTTYGDRRDAANGCNDDTYSKPQVHGSVGMGVAASNHASANYETTELNVNKALGSCDEPKGDVNASIRITRSNMNFGRRNGP